MPIVADNPYVCGFHQRNLGTPFKGKIGVLFLTVGQSNFGNKIPFFKSSTFQGVKTVIIPNKVTQNVELFVDALETCQVTRLFAVTSLIKNLLTFVEMEAKQKKSKPRLNKVITHTVISEYFQIKE